MVDLVVTDNKTKNYFFKNLFENKSITKIGVRLSSGTDSALVLFFLAKFITELEKFYITIYPWTGIELNNELSVAEEKAIKIVDVIRQLYPKVNIKNTHVDKWLRIPPLEKPQDKKYYSNPAADKFKAENNLDLLISGSTCNPPKEIIESEKMETMFCKAPKYRHVESVTDSSIWGHTDEKEFPWRYVDKKFIAHQYKKYNLMENLYPLTESCVIEKFDILLEMGANSFPCKTCYWCREKYWAFGSYDGGIQ